MQSLNYKALGETLKIYFISIRQYDKASKFHQSTRKGSLQPLCVVLCSALALVSRLAGVYQRRVMGSKMAVGTRYGYSFSSSEYKFACDYCCGKTPKIHTQIKKRIVGFKIYRRMSRVTGHQVAVCGSIYCGSEKHFCGFVNPFRVLDVTLMTEAVYSCTVNA